MSRAPVTNERPIAYAAMNASCTMPSSPMPAILPASSCRGRIAESRISTTRDAFSSITPVATHTPYPKSWPYASSTAMNAIAGVLLAVGILRFERPHLDRGLGSAPHRSRSDPRPRPRAPRAILAPDRARCGPAASAWPGPRHPPPVRRRPAPHRAVRSAPRPRPPRRRPRPRPELTPSRSATSSSPAVVRWIATSRFP